MKTGIGLPVFPGVSIGPAVVYRKSERTLPVSSGDPAVEQAKFEAARETAREQLAALYEKAKAELGDLWKTEEDVMSYICFPDQARKYLEKRKADEEKVCVYTIEEA